MHKLVIKLKEADCVYCVVRTESLKNNSGYSYFLNSLFIQRVSSYCKGCGDKLSFELLQERGTQRDVLNSIEVCAWHRQPAWHRLRTNVLPNMCASFASSYCKSEPCHRGGLQQSVGICVSWSSKHISLGQLKAIHLNYRRHSNMSNVPLNNLLNINPLNTELNPICQ